MSQTKTIESDGFIIEIVESAAEFSGFFWRVKTTGGQISLTNTQAKCLAMAIFDYQGEWLKMESEK